MFIFNAKSVSSRQLEGMILSLIRATISEPVRAKTERIRNAAFYEEYARLCLLGAFPNELITPESLAARGITEEDVDTAVTAIWGFRSGSDLLASELSLECRWMLEGYAGIPGSVGLQPWEWRKGLSRGAGYRFR